jgi:hypothetical protein
MFALLRLVDGVHLNDSVQQQLMKKDAAHAKIKQLSFGATSESDSGVGRCLSSLLTS